MTTKVTLKQEKYLQNLLKGMSQRQAYKEAFQCKNWKDSSIDSSACQLLSKPKVAQRYRELLEEIKSKSIMSATERREYLTSIIMTDLGRIEDKLKALDILNKMDGEYTTNTNVNAIVNGGVVIVNDIENEG